MAALKWNKVAFTPVSTDIPSRGSRGSEAPYDSPIGAIDRAFERFKEATNFSVTDIVYYINTELISLYQQARQDNYSQIPFVEQVSFQDWLFAYFD